MPGEERVAKLKEALAPMLLAQGTNEPFQLRVGQPPHNR